MQDTLTVMLTTEHGSEPEPVEIPARIGAVKLGEMLGEGAGGVVFAGFDEALHRRVAVKLLHRRRDAAGDLGMRELVKGVRAAARIRHPNIITIHAVESAAGMPVIVMEYVDGLSMRDLSASAGRLELPLALYVMRSVISAVAALHEVNVVHRDLKPANVLFDRQGEARVCDFGLACEFDPAAYRSDAASIGGSPLYMAPEMFDGEASPQSDVYALGTMLFEALSGQPPFSAQSISEIRECHATREVPLWILEERGIPGDLCELVRRSLHKQRYLRTKSAAHMLRSLENAGSRTTDDEAMRARIAALVATSRGISESSTTAPETEEPPAKTMFDLVARRAARKRTRDSI